MSTGKGKKLVYVSENLIEQAAKVSRDEGVSLSKLVEAALTQVVKVNELGYTSKEVAAFFNVLQTHRVLGGLFVPSGVLDYMIKNCRHNASQVQRLWFESGQWNGKYLKETFDDPVEAFKDFMELSRWDLNEVDIKVAGVDVVKVRCVSTVMTLESTALLAKYVEGVMTGLGYTTHKLDCLKGMIILESRK
ncbi:MAG: hypothetical protein NWF04_10505 [Candidatus Bathyarchaeota archaeon]|nr:hypothetical protein [Candidatus Bathyarchaeota archaeon]